MPFTLNPTSAFPGGVAEVEARIETAMAGGG